MSPCHSRQPSIISDASAAEGDRSSTPSDINSPRHRTHSLCNVSPRGQPGAAGCPRCVPAVSTSPVPFLLQGDSPGPVQKNLHNPIVQVGHHSSRSPSPKSSSCTREWFLGYPEAPMELLSYSSMFYPKKLWVFMPMVAGPLCGFAM